MKSGAKHLGGLLIGLMCWQIALAQVPSPAPAQDHPILIFNGTAHLGTGEEIERAAILFENGRITEIFDLLLGDVDTSTYEEVIDATGKHIYPGFIASNSILGLTEIGAIRSSSDYRDVAGFNPNLRTITSYNTDSKITPTVRSNGVLTSQVVPRGGVISGTSSIVKLDAWNWEDASIRTDDGIHLNWPRHKGPKAKPEKAEEKKKEKDPVEEIHRFFEQAKAYCEVNDHEDRNLRYEAMRGIFSGKQKLFVHADRAYDILQAITFVRKFKIKNVVLVGAHDAYLLVDQLSDNQIPVILRRVHSLPLRTDEDINLPYKLPGMLHEAGVPFALCYEGDMEAMGTRNLPFTAGTAVAHGLEYEEAVKAITLAPAKILGIDKDLGSLEKGKLATLFISSGDALDMRGNKVETAFIEGRMIDLNNHQKQLYEKFRARLVAPEE